MKYWLRACWSVIRELASDDAYERYVQRHAQVHPDAQCLDRRAFYLSELQRKWHGVRRCC
jgi:uncharacterized short protein YbdD (DUF466 family)